MRLSIAAALALLLVSTPLGAGDPGLAIDGLWFKVKVKAKGWAYGEPLPEPKKKSLSTTCYVNLELDTMAGEGGPAYTVAVWSESAPGVWNPNDIDGDVVDPGTGSELYLFSAADFSVSQPDGGSIQCEAVMALLPSKIDDLGFVEKAKFSALGARVDSGTLGDGSTFRGGATLKGKTVDVEDLPFVPPA